MIKNMFKWLGIIFLGFISLIIIVAVYSGYKQSEYNETAVPYIKKVIPIISEWDIEKAKPLFVSATFENTSDEDFEKLFRWLSKLGTLKNIEDPTFTQVHSGATIQDGTSTIVTYTVIGHYENGDATITIRLLDSEDSFEIYHFKINSLALIE
ncbi:hypothetical protein JK628_15515 [Shewanella sp. KX20019]|uniref:hypothetical protein n=1 Tax=Shewanella sp. KX20019 TaxID=2803864 RepID=UPI00192919C3|nr:hypothetical protein [Shewanella sp. KX20019]QQX78962.1 hypothetical protein JK628_15515 [Shewanella sp. KX20019]